MADNSNVNGARYSAINAMDNCPRSCWLTYGKKLKGYKNPYARLGIAIHDVLEAYGKHCIERKEATDYDFYDNLVSRSISTLEQDLHNDVRQIFENIKKTTNWEALIEYNEVHVENRYALDSNLNYLDLGIEEPYFSGGIDLLYIDDQDICQVSDYKSVRKIYTDAYMRDSLQRKFYSFLAYKYFGDRIKGVEFKFNFVRYGVISKGYFASIDEIKEEFGQLLKDKIELYYDLIKQEEPPVANPSGFCILCENKGQCDEYKNAFSMEERIANDSDAVTLMNQYKLAQLKIKNIQDLLKTWVDVHGPIVGKKDQWGPVLENKTKFDTVAMWDILQKMGIPPGAILEILNMNKTGLAKLVKKFGKKGKEADSFIEKNASITATTKFKFTEVECEDTEEEEESDGFFDPYV